MTYSCSSDGERQAMYEQQQQRRFVKSFLISEIVLCGSAKCNASHSSDSPLIDRHGDERVLEGL